METESDGSSMESGEDSGEVSVEEFAGGELSDVSLPNSHWEKQSTNRTPVAQKTARYGDRWKKKVNKESSWKKQSKKVIEGDAFHSITCRQILTIYKNCAQVGEKTQQQLPRPLKSGKGCSRARSKGKSPVQPLQRVKGYSGSRSQGKLTTHLLQHIEDSRSSGSKRKLSDCATESDLDLDGSVSNNRSNSDGSDNLDLLTPPVSTKTR